MKRSLYLIALTALAAFTYAATPTDFFAVLDAAFASGAPLAGRAEIPNRLAKAALHRFETVEPTEMKTDAALPDRFTAESAVDALFVLVPPEAAEDAAEERYAPDEEPDAPSDSESASPETDSALPLTERVDEEAVPPLPVRTEDRRGGAAVAAEEPLGDIAEVPVRDLLPEPDRAAQKIAETPAAEPETLLEGDAPSVENAVTETSPDSSEEDSPPENRIVPSRSVIAKMNQLIDIEYPGKGWVYQGNLDENGARDMRQNNFAFGGRTFNSQNQLFTVRARRAGRYLLHFYKDDVLTGRYIDDYLEAVVEEESETADARIKAPDYTDVVPPRPAAAAPPIGQAHGVLTRISFWACGSRPEPSAHYVLQMNSGTNAENAFLAAKGPELAAANTASDGGGQIETAPGGAVSIADSMNGEPEKQTGGSGDFFEAAAPVLDASSSQSLRKPVQSAAGAHALSPDELLDDAQKRFENKEYAEALSELSDFFERSLSRIDEGLFLQGRIFESQSEVRNIKNAIAAYDRLLRLYPVSAFREPATKRSVYLKRFYIDIR